MTRKEIINEINCLLSELDNGEDAVSYLTQNDVNWLNENIKALDQDPIIDKIRARIELEKLGYPPSAGYYKAIMKVLQIIDKYKAESEVQDADSN